MQANIHRPEYEFILIGLDYDGSILSSRISEAANIKWLGPKPCAEIPRYLKYFDVATIPFELSDVTHATSTLKLFEYMAGGKPIVATAMREYQKYPVGLIAHSPGAFNHKLDEALKLWADPKYRAALERTANENTWDIRAKNIFEALASGKESE